MMPTHVDGRLESYVSEKCVTYNNFENLKVKTLKSSIITSTVNTILSKLFL